MELALQVFIGVSMILGVVCLLGFTLWALGQATVGLLKMLKVWYVLALVVGVLVRGRDYRDQMFWEAVRERVKDSGFEAKTIAEFALKHAPNDGGGI